MKVKEERLLAYPIEWDDVRRDNKYPADDNNNGFIYGIEWMDGDEVSDMTWYKTEEERWSTLAQQCLKCGSNGHITDDHEMPRTHSLDQLVKFGWEGIKEYIEYEESKEE
jgi:ribosomal protein S27AE